MKLAALAALVLGLDTLGLAQGKEQPGKEAPGKLALYFLFSENSRGAPEAARAVTSFLACHPGEAVLRPELLVQDWKELGRVTEESPLFRTLRELRVPLRVYDEEALRLAAAWKISRLPAAVLVRDGRAHVVQGASVDLESLFRCSR